MSCAVPVRTPVVEGGLEKPVASAGAYYLAALTDSLAVLKRNPNYGGSRPQHLDAIVVEFNVPAAEAATRIEGGTLDYFFESQQATLTSHPGRARGRRSVPPDAGGSSFSPSTMSDRFSPMCGCARPSSTRSTAARSSSKPERNRGTPSDAPALPEHPRVRREAAVPLRSDIRTAQARRYTAQVFVSSWNDPVYDAPFNQALREQLATIGLRMTIIELSQKDSRSEALAKILRSDLIWGSLNEHTADPADYLKGLPPAGRREGRRDRTSHRAGTRGSHTRRKDRAGFAVRRLSD